MTRGTWNGFKQPVEYCRNGGKVCYDKISARTAVNHRFEEDHVKLRIYPCPACQRARRKNVWHITHFMKDNDDDQLRPLVHKPRRHHEDDTE